MKALSCGRNPPTPENNTGEPVVQAPDAQAHPVNCRMGPNIGTIAGKDLSIRGKALIEAHPQWT